MSGWQPIGSEKAKFHKGDRVLVMPVGTVSVVQEIVPLWILGQREPVRIFYECGLGRLFEADELRLAELRS